MCDYIGCDREPDYKLTTLENDIILTCLRHHNNYIEKGNIFNIMDITDSNAEL